MGWWQMLGEYLAALVATAGDVLRLSPQALERADRFGWSVPIGIAVVAGMSLLVGQSLVLAINRVGRRRGVLTMVTSGAGQVLIAVVEAVMVWAVAIVLLDEPPRVSELLPTVLVSFAPQWLGFLVLLPFTGTGIARLLQVWHLLALWVMLTPVLDAGRPAALLVAAAAWLVTEAIDALVEHSPLRLRERLFRLVSGSAGRTWRDVMASSPMERTP
ncbi:MAG: hypothetical protein WBL05_03775 [Brooklawnia sp.]|uniref:hypothetical protein n=1 Tax=Brooklawnia sp. TaxID=2699740 RepID=UPI003C78CAE3